MYDMSRRPSSALRGVQTLIMIKSISTRPERSSAMLYILKPDELRRFSMIVGEASRPITLWPFDLKACMYAEPTTPHPIWIMFFLDSADDLVTVFVVVGAHILEDCCC